MFTGLVEARGTVDCVLAEQSAVRLQIAVPAAMAGETRVGDSVAVNGCCLTVVTLDGNRLSFQAGDETLSKTNLGELAAGDAVNLERPLPANGRLGGHFVQGHVDVMGHVAAIEADGDWAKYWFAVPERLSRQMVAKGSVAVDGISLTLVDVETTRFSVALIPHTLQVTTLGTRKVGDAVNIETDVLAKYVQKQLEAAGLTGNNGT